MAPILSTLLLVLYMSISVELVPLSLFSSQTPENPILADLHVLRKALGANGGSPGTLGLIRRHDGTAGRENHSNCTNWSYDNTTSFPTGKFRHEHATLQAQDTSDEYVQYTGFYGERYIDQPYVVHYTSNNRDTLSLSQLQLCIAHEWGALTCKNKCEGRTHYVFHDEPQVGCQDVPQSITTPTTLSNGELLEAEVGVWPKPLDKDNNLNLNVLPLLEFYGGAPGFVTASRVRPFPTFNVTSDLDLVLEDDEARDVWLYNYRYTNASTALRFEHAILRKDDVDDLYEDIQGSMYWRSASGDYFIEYRQNNSGLFSNVQPAKINVYRALWTVTTPPSEDCSFLSKTVGGFLASLVG